MTSHYHQRLLTGEKELADNLRPLVEPLRRQCDTKEEQAVCLQELGELYLKAGVESKNGKDFTKAAALFNAALVRTSKEEVQKQIKGHLVVVRQEFMTAFYPDAKLILQEQWEEIRMQNINTLENIRTNIKDNSRRFKLLLDRYDIESKDKQEIEECLVNEAKQLTLQVQEEMLEFIRVLWNQSMEFSNGIPPCKYSMIGLGSLARQEVTPYSDLEFAILVREKSDEVERYFENLTYLFHIYVLDLGETPIPQMAIPSLNDFTAPGGDWFFDKITPSGFKFDGEMPWACKTPTGRQVTCNISPLSFIKTPVEMVELLKDDSVLGQSYRVSEVLKRTLHIIGDFDLYNIYQKEVIKIPHESDTSFLTSKGGMAVMDDLNDLWCKDTPYRTAKHRYYRMPSIFLEKTRQWLTPYFQGGSQWCVIEHLTQMKKLSEEDAFQSKVAISLSYGVRLLTYFTNRGQREQMETDQVIRDPGMKSIEFTLRKRFPLIIARILFANIDEDTPSVVLKKLTTSSYNKQKHYPLSQNVIVSSDVDPVSQIVQSFEELRPTQNVPSILKFFCSCYIGLAKEEKVLPLWHCGDTCQIKKITNLEWGIPNINDLDFLIENTHLCVCVSMVKTYLEVHRYLTQRYLKLSQCPPDVYLNYIFGELSKRTEVRDMLFLNFNLLKLAYFSTDVSVLKRVATSAEIFLSNVMVQLPKRNAHERSFKFMKFDFYGWLSHIYEFLGEYEKETKLLESWVDILETQCPGGDFDIENIGTYFELGMALLRNPDKEQEAIRLYRKALKRFEDRVRSNSSKDINENILAKSVLKFAEMLVGKKLCEESEALLKEYFFNDNKSCNFTNEHIVEALWLLAHCYEHSERLMECSEVCEQIYLMVKYKGAGKHFSARHRAMIGELQISMYKRLGNIIDLPKAAESHKLVCNSQKDKKLAAVEHKIFLLMSSLLLFTCRLKYMGVHYLIQALALDDPAPHRKKLHFSKTDMWLHILVVLCDTINSYRSFTDMEFLITTYRDINFWQSNLSKINKTSLDLYQIYVDYRLCHYLVSIVMDRDTSFALKLKETIDYLYQTQIRLTKFFPKCTTAIKWCKDIRLCLNPNAENVTPQDYITDPRFLINLTQMHVYEHRLEEDILEYPLSY